VRPELAVLPRIAQEVDDFGQFLLRLVDPGHVREGRMLLRRLILLRLRTPEREHAAGCAAGPPDQPDPQCDEENRRAEADE
jgi:hypothetical protein